MPKGYTENTTIPTPEIIADILSSDLSIRKLGKKHNMGYAHVRNILKRAGILKTTKAGAPIKDKKTKPYKVEKSPKVPELTKELPIKVIKKEAKLTANTKFELEKERLDNAKSAQEKYKEMEAKKFEEGYRYVEKVDRFGLKRMALVKEETVLVKSI